MKQAQIPFPLNCGTIPQPRAPFGTMNKSTQNKEEPAGFKEAVELSGHIIDSLILPKVLDCITTAGGRFEIQQITIGHARKDPSYALVEVQAPTEQRLIEILETIADHGAKPIVDHDCRLVAADVNGAFPEGFYSTTNQRTQIRLDGNWIDVDDQEMDCGNCRGDGCRAGPLRPDE